MTAPEYTVKFSYPMLALLAACGSTKATVLDGDQALRFANGDCAQALGRDPVELGSALTVEAWLQVEPEEARAGALVAMPEAFVLWVSPEGAGLSPSDDADAGARTGIPVMDGEVHHVAATFNADGGQLFVDGYRAGTSDWWELPAGVDSVVLGCWAATGQAFEGVMDEVRISSVVRYERNFVPASTRFEVDADTLALWHLDTGAGSRALDEALNFDLDLDGPEWTSGLIAVEPADTGDVEDTGAP